MNLPASVALILLYGWLMAGSGPTSSGWPLTVAFKPLGYATAEQPADIQSEKEAIFVATNQQRARKHLPLLRQQAKLMQAAQDYADLMAARDQMSHTLNGLSLADKANRVAYSFGQLSENIALNTRLAGRSVVIDQWMESTGHRRNLLTRTVTDIGIGIAGPSRQNRYYYCQLFGAEL